jgi:hypothetical protein
MADSDKKTMMQSMMQSALDAQSAAGAAKAKKTPPKVVPMTKEDAEVINSKEFKKASEATMDKKKGGMIKTKKYSKGGTASSRADGIATKGKTKGKIC